MNILSCDAETYFSDDYTLKRQTTEAYCRDPRFECHGWGFRFPNGEKQWLTARSDILEVFKFAKVSKCAVLCHHAHFDGLIMSHHYGFTPDMWLDTLSMARMVHGNHLSAGLESLSRHYGYPGKVLNYDGFKGKHWHEMGKATQENVAEGCLDDVEKMWRIFLELSKTFPASEYPIVDMTIRMFTEPVLRGDTEILGQLWHQENDRKNSAMKTLGVSKSQLQSNDQFAELLRAEGIEPATKPGKPNADGTEKRIYAFAKSDDFMQELQESENERVEMLATARLGAKSTLLQTRAERMGNMATRGALCVYLLYCGAHTTRWSGGDKLNFQNPPRHKAKKRSLLRDAIQAAEGEIIIVVDASQIECRILNHQAGQHDILEAFAQKRDVYCEQATDFYGRPITKADAEERYVGKKLVLSCGYGVGWGKFQATLRAGIDGPKVILDDEEAKAAINSYRSRHKAVTAYWRTCGEEILPALASGAQMQFGAITIANKKAYAPNGAWINYDTLEWHTDPDTGEQYWRMRNRKGWTKQYGGRLTENFIQFLARQHVAAVMLEARAAGLKVAFMSHDEIAVPVRNDERAAPARDWLIERMRTPPAWLPGIPLDAEGSMAVRYGDAK
jgi:hypothetical protein